MKKISILWIAVCLMTFLVGCGGQENQPSIENSDSSQTTQTQELVDNEKIDKPVVHLAGGDIGVPNPFRHIKRGPGKSKMQLLYDSLLESDENSYIPWLAKNHSVDDSGLLYSFELVDNAKWHDGNPLTVEDVIFTFDYYRDHPPVDNMLSINGEYFVESVTKTGDWAFDVKVNAKDNTHLIRLGGVRILPQHIWSKVEDPITYEGEGATIGSGPYKMTHYDSAKGEYRYEAFEEYWGLEPAASAIEWIPVSDKILAFENKEIDLVNVSPDLLDRYKSDPSFTVKTIPSYHCYRLMMNMDKTPALLDVNLRQAMAYGINRQALVEKLGRGGAELNSMGYLPASNKGWYNPDVPPYNYDVEKAKALLAGKTYSFKLTIGSKPVEAKIAELIQNDLEKIGITIDIESIEKKSRDQAVKNGNYEMLLIYFGGMGGDPDYLRTIYGNSSIEASTKKSSLIKGYYNPEVTDLATQQAVAETLDDRKAIVYKLQEKIAEDVPMIMLYSKLDNFVYRHEMYSHWTERFYHSKLDHSKLSYLIRAND